MDSMSCTNAVLRKRQERVAKVIAIPPRGRTEHIPVSLVVEVLDLSLVDRLPRANHLSDIALHESSRLVNRLDHMEIHGYVEGSEDLVSSVNHDY